MKRLWLFLKRSGRWIVGKRNADGTALWLASVAYSFLLLVVSPRVENQYLLAILAAVPFAMLLYLLRIATHRLWADHLCGQWIYVSYPYGFPDEVDPKDLGKLGQPRFGLAEVSVSPSGAISLKVDLYSSRDSVLAVLNDGALPTFKDRIGMLQSRAADYDTGRDTLFVAYEVDYFHQEPKRDGGLQIRPSPASPAAVLPGTWRSWIPGQRESSRFGQMQLYRPEEFRRLGEAELGQPGLDVPVLDQARNSDTARNSLN